MEKYPKIFIVILNYNGRKVLSRCLRSVFQTDYPDFKVVLVDNNSSDSSLEMARSNFPKAFFIKNEENLGFSAGNNVGIKFSLERGADYVLLLNYDTEVRKDFLKKLIVCSFQNGSWGILSPVIFKGDSDQIWFGGGKIDWLRMKIKHDTKIKSRSCRESAFISGCAMLVKAEVFKKIGLLDEDFFLYWEDADFGVRARKAGFKLGVVFSSQARHFEKEETAQKIYWLVLSGLVFFKKNAPLWLKLWVSFYVFLRKFKNKLDLRFRENEDALMVKKAYDDFYYCKL